MNTNSIEEAAKDEAIRTVSEYYPFDRDDIWYKHGLGLAERMFKRGAEWEQPKHTENEIIAGQVHEIDSLRGKLREKIAASESHQANTVSLQRAQEIRKRVKHYNDDILAFNVWFNKTYPAQPMQEAIEKQVSERIAGYIHEIDSLRGTIRELGEKIKEGNCCVDIHHSKIPQSNPKKKNKKLK